MTRIKAKLGALPVEELANTITHGFGLFLSVIGFVVLVVLASLSGDSLSIIGCVTYGLSLVILYAASTIYHSATSPKLKRRLQIADHCGIYLLIAGSYTPFGLIILNRELGQNLLIAIWVFAMLGILAKLVLRQRYPALSVISYLVMGWIGVFAIQPLLEAIGLTAIALVVAGGIAYSLGVIFFAWHRIPHNHAIFHVFILAGSIFHYLAVVLYVVPYSINL
ncbi:MAG: hemolysin III family protein [Pyrinomonadaceae bacterium]